MNATRCITGKAFMPCKASMTSSTTSRMNQALHQTDT